MTKQKSPSVGLIATTLHNGEGQLFIWYPSEDRAHEFYLEPFTIMVAVNGKPMGGKYPVILFSHGYRGRVRNHWQTAIHLAQSGNIVLTPHHRFDRHLLLVRQIEHRTAELSAALSQIAHHPMICAIANMEQIGAVGYSIGSTAMLLLAGAIPSVHTLSTHCSPENRKRDPYLCSALRWITLQIMITRLFRRRKSFFNLPTPIAIKAIVLVAPMGVLFCPESFEKLESSISIHRFGADKILCAPFHAERLRTMLQVEEQDYHLHEKAGHFSFLNPFPESAIAAMKRRSRALFADLPGFDRSACIAALNREMASFFRRKLGDSGRNT